MMAGIVRRQGKYCFFEKKQQKTFDSFWLRAPHHLWPSIAKIFCALFFKKAPLPSSSLGFSS
jgi:hypothetical protein